MNLTQKVSVGQQDSSVGGAVIFQPKGEQFDSLSRQKLRVQKTLKPCITTDTGRAAVETTISTNRSIIKLSLII